jgi:hypothetical protein
MPHGAVIIGGNVRTAMDARCTRYSIGKVGSGQRWKVAVSEEAMGQRQASQQRMVRMVMVGAIGCVEAWCTELSLG